MPEHQPHHQQSFNSESLDSKISRLLTLQETDQEGRIIFRKEITKQLKTLADRIDSQGDRLSKTSQTTEFLLKDNEQSAGKLDSINKKLDYTNGCIGEAKRDIFDLQTKIKKQELVEPELNDILAFKNFIHKWLLNRYAAGFFIIFLIGINKVIHNQEFRELLYKVIGLN